MGLLGQQSCGGSPDVNGLAKGRRLREAGAGGSNPLTPTKYATPRALALPLSRWDCDANAGDPSGYSSCGSRKRFCLPFALPRNPDAPWAGPVQRV